MEKRSIWLAFAALTGFLLLVCLPARAQMYKYEDEEGNLHFTDQPQNIPERYRSRSNESGSRNKADTPADAQDDGSSSVSEAEGDASDTAEEFSEADDVESNADKDEPASGGDASEVEGKVEEAPEDSGGGLEGVSSDD